MSRRPVRARSETGDARDHVLLPELDLFAIYSFVRTSGGSVRMSGQQLADLALFRSGVGDRRPEGWLAASLTALDGSELGAIQLFDKDDGGFTRDDEAVIVHLAQMASAAVERARLYQEPG